MKPPATGVLADALLAARLCSLDPDLGGVRLIGDDADARDEMVAAFREGLPADAPVRRIAANIDEDRLVGGMDLGAALAGEGIRMRPGLLAEADGGLVVIPAVERLSPIIEALIGTALDRHEIIVARDGLAASTPARFVVLAFDEDREGAGAGCALGERLAFHIRSDQPAMADDCDHDAALDDKQVFHAIAETALALGVDTARAANFALKAARASAVFEGRAQVCQADIVRAVRLVLLPRATRLPPEPADAAPDEQREDNASDGESQSRTDTLEDRVLDAVRAAIDPDLIARIEAMGRTRAEGRRARGAGDRRRSKSRGRPVGVRAGEPRGGARLALVATLRAAAPWQRLRGRTGRVIIHASDLRIRRYEARAALVTIFAVDASGSAAATRLAEAKGAVELLLAQAYIQRAEVALVAFRGTQAELLLPPTRSLTRARRALADLPGGGGTPLASGLASSHAVATAVRAKGSTPFLVVLSDGRANIAADGSVGRPAADRDAMQAARLVAADGVPSVFIDTAPRARPEGSRIAAAMGARYLPLPYADANVVQQAVSALAPGRT
jgi:magnesium chelatase subunit D